MGTAKRERQKANRQLKKIEEVKAAKRAVGKKWALRLGIGIPVAVALMFGLAQVFGDDEAPTPTTVPVVVETTLVGG